MKFDAHPLAVAVALGLLGRGVLEFEDERDDEAAVTEPTLEPTTVAYEPGPAPDPEEFHRVEIEWLKSQG